MPRFRAVVSHVIDMNPKLDGLHEGNFFLISHRAEKQKPTPDEDKGLSVVSQLFKRFAV